MGGRGGNGVDSPGASALKNRVDQGSKAPSAQQCMRWFLLQPPGCEDRVEITVGLSWDKSLSLNTSALELKVTMLLLPRLSPTELSQPGSGILHL